MHGSIIANSQLFMDKTIDLDLLNTLITTVICSSYVSKILISCAIGSNYLKKKLFIWSLLTILPTLTVAFVIIYRN